MSILTSAETIVIHFEKLNKKNTVIMNKTQIKQNTVKKKKKKNELKL